MKPVINTEFGADTPRDDIQVLKALDDGPNGRGIRVGDDSESKEAERLLGKHGTNSAWLLPSV
jgi:hypothetical protein